MRDQRVVIALTRADLVRQHAHTLHPDSRRPGKWSAEIDESLRFNIALEFDFLGFGERAPFHDVPDALFGVAGNHVVGNHLVFDDV